ncbi:hypothetical protein [Deinococcus yunweiensis]|uniref:hypothetical protein n=1 Tax=Deinococcus yunweiensis TaxID=367282 RepID=UPI00398E5AF2
MKRALLTVLALTLAACAPVAQLAQPNETATLTLDARSVVLANPGPDALTGDPSRPGDGVALTLRGTAMVPDILAAQWCGFNLLAVPVVPVDSLSCSVPAVPAESEARVTLTAGTISDGAAFAYRPSSGARPVIVWLTR